MNNAIRKSPALILGASTGLVICGAVAAFWTTFFMRSHHSVVSPHSDSEGTATLVLFIGILLGLIALPMIGAFRFSCSKFPTPLRLVIWSFFAAFLIVVTTTDGRPYLLPYTGAASFAYLFACDSMSAFRSRSWATVAISSVTAVICSAGFFIMCWAFLYAE
ncbi:MAG: hypothetical protein V4689_13870 [Verrucomicrobiota bacterium]